MEPRHFTIEALACALLYVVNTSSGALDLLRNSGTHPERQRCTWGELAGLPTSKLDSDAYTRVRIILMNGIESEALRFSHACARFQPQCHRELAMVRRADQYQQTLVNWLLPADMSPLEPRCRS